MNNRFGYRNPILRRVLRHAAVTVLFRQNRGTDFLANRSGLEQNSVEGSYAHAFILPQPNRMAYTPEEVGMDAPISRPNPATTSLPKPLPASTTLPVPVPTPVRSDELPNDPVWRRLQNIFRKHQEAEAQTTREAEGSAPSPDADTVQMVPSQPQLERGGTATDEPQKRGNDHTQIAPTPLTEVAQRRSILFEEHEPLPARAKSKGEFGGSVPSEPETESGHQESPLEHRETAVDSSVRRSIEGGVKKTHSPAKEQNTEVTRTDASMSQPPPARSSEQFEPVREASEGRTEAKLEGQPVQSTKTRGASPAPTSMLDSRDTREFTTPEEEVASTTAENPEQPVSLEAVWPVEVRGGGSVTESKISSAEYSHQPVSATISEPADEKSHQEVKKILQRIAPADKSDSGVEVITPRQGKPAVLSRKPLPISPHKPSTPIPDTLSPSPEPGPIEGAPELLKDDSQPIQTEIGALPSDLWQLLDEPVPQRDVPSAQPARIRTIPPAAEPSAVRRKHIPSGQPASTKLNPVSKDVVQRQEESSPSSETATPGSGQSPPAVNENAIEDLSRRVFNEIRRKLQLEWERIRRS